MESKLLTATKNGLTKTFTRKQWEVLGTDKYGWALVPSIPKEVAPIAEMVDSIQKPRGRKPKEQ